MKNGKIAKELVDLARSVLAAGKGEAAGLAHKWMDAYRAGHISDEVDAEIIRAMLDYPMTPEVAKHVFFSKQLRWFYDMNGDTEKFVNTKNAYSLMSQYLKGNKNKVKDFIKDAQAGKFD